MYPWSPDIKKWAREKYLQNHNIGKIEWKICLECYDSDLEKITEWVKVNNNSHVELSVTCWPTFGRQDTDSLPTHYRQPVNSVNQTVCTNFCIYLLPNLFFYTK